MGLAKWETREIKAQRTYLTLSYAALSFNSRSCEHYVYDAFTRMTTCVVTPSDILAVFREQRDKLFQISNIYDVNLQYQERNSVKLNSENVLRE